MTTEEGNKIISEIKYSVKSSKDLLTIRLHQYYILPKIKFVRRREVKKIVSDTVIAEYKITVPFEIKEEQREKWMDYTHFHNDCELVKWVEKIKTYKEPELQNFIKEKINPHLSNGT